MMHFFSTLSLSALFSFTLLVSNVAGHGLVTSIQGANGKNGVGLGITDPTGKKLRLFNQAPRYLKGDTSACGSQKLDGKAQTPINFQKALSTAISAGLPTADAEGNVKMTLFQVNADGAGPYTCEVSADASGKNFQPVQVTQQIPGTKGKSNVANKAFPFGVKLPKGLVCTGQQGACLIRCKSGVSQPFGGCIAVAQSKPTKNAAAKRTSFDDLETINEPVARDEDEVEDEVDSVEPEIEEHKITVVSRLFKRDALEEEFGDIFDVELHA